MIEHIESHYDRLVKESRSSIIEEIMLFNLFEVITKNEKLSSIINDVNNDIQNKEDYFKAFNSEDFKFSS